MRPFLWSEKSEQAALLVSQDKQSDVEIASACGIGRATLERWKKTPAFAARVAEHAAAWRDAFQRRGIAEKQNRIDAKVTRHQLLEQVRQARAHAYQAAPGGDTGLIVGKVALVKVYDAGDDPEEDEDGGSGTLFSAKRYREVWEYSLDTGLLKEYRDLEKQIAQELGEWVDKQALTDSKGDDLSLDALMERYALAHGRQGAAESE